jgi:hypothetical protein
MRSLGVPEGGESARSRAGNVGQEIDNFSTSRLVIGIVFQKSVTGPALASHGRRARTSVFKRRELTREWRLKPLKSLKTDSGKGRRLGVAKRIDQANSE